MKVQRRDRRVKKALGRIRRAPVYRWEGIRDPRHRRGRRWKLGELIDRLFEGMLAGCRSLRRVETLSEECGERRRIADTTLYEVVGELEPYDFRRSLHQQVRTQERRKALEPEGLPCGVLAIDGKALATLDHDAGGRAQKETTEDGWPYWVYRVLRAVLVSAAGKPCVDQKTIPASTNEAGVFEEFWSELLAAYGRTNLFEIVTGDAGLNDRAIADRIDGDGYGYVLALKNDQPTLRAEAERLLAARTGQTPDAETPWQRVGGCDVRRRLYRTTEIAGYHGWTRLRAAWLVVQETRPDFGPIQIETRYFLTNLRPGRLTPSQCLQVVRMHWGIENDCFWSLDVQWGEDAGVWSTQGRALEVLGLLRAMAYNVCQHLRKRHLRQRRSDGTIEPPPDWQSVFRWVEQAFRLPTEVTPIPNAG